MTRIVVFAGALSAALFAGTQTSSAYEGPWCAHMSVGRGFVDNRCDMRSFAMCRAEIAGIPGAWCNHNPYYYAMAEEPRRRKAKRRVR
jgi:hypothetical protein